MEKGPEEDDKKLLEPGRTTTGFSNFRIFWEEILLWRNGRKAGTDVIAKRFAELVIGLEIGTS